MMVVRSHNEHEASLEEETLITEKNYSSDNLHYSSSGHLEYGFPIDIVGIDGSVVTDKITKSVLKLGPSFFVDNFMKKGEAFEPETILRAFGCTLPENLKHMDESNKWSYLRYFLTRHVYERPRLESFCTLDNAVDLIREARNIMVVTGAGISVNCGIPDFRSKGGLYDSIRAKYDLPEPECIFDIEFFRINPEPFYDFAKEILLARSLSQEEDKYEIMPGFSHYFIRQLEKRGKLLRQYTQNIDMLEEKAGIERTIYCHGSFSTSSCLSCGQKIILSQLLEIMRVGNIPQCKKCGRKEKDDGIFKPDIVFFGEPLPRIFEASLEDDVHRVDLFIVIGSSMKVHPVSAIPDMIPAHIPQILINQESLDHNFDIELLGDCEVILANLFRKLEWINYDDPIGIPERFNDLLKNKVDPTSLPPNHYIFPDFKTVSKNSSPMDKII